MIKRLLSLLGLIILCQGIGAAGALFTAEAVGSWYVEIKKPFFNPPAWVFGPVWTILYIMMAVACWMILNSPKKEPLRKSALILFFTQLFVNGIWSPLFFGLKNPALAFADIVVLWVLIGLTVRVFLRIHKTAGRLMIPYWFWVSFAAVLNFSLWQLNR